MLRISSYTFGCKLNQSETDSALAILAELGYEVVPWESGADLYLINTCTVTTKGEQKARRLIRQVQQLWPRAAVLATGCYAVLDRQRLEALGERVCALPDQPGQLCQVLAEQPLANSDELLELLRSSIARQLAAGGRQLRADQPRQIDFPQALLRQPGALPYRRTDKSVSPQTRTRQRYFLKIQDGCNRTCSFCRIRIARGPSRSLALPLLLRQLQQLETEGYAEVVITGVHINSYHYRDEASGRDYFLGELLQELLAQTQRVRLRLSSLEPEGLESGRAQGLLRALASRRICPHFHISIQSGSEHVLRQMRRGYTAAQQLRYIERLKELRPRAFFSCDVIVGFPGEREEDFAATYSLLQDQEFAAVHAFSYSPRPGTDAFAMPKIQNSLVKQRMTRLQTLAAQLQNQYLQSNLNQVAQVLLEEQHQGYWYGYSENYVRVRIAAAPSAVGSNLSDQSDSQNWPDWQRGDLVTVRLQPCTESDTKTAETEQPDEHSNPLLLEGLPLLLIHRPVSKPLNEPVAMIDTLPSDMPAFLAGQSH